MRWGNCAHTSLSIIPCSLVDATINISEAICGVFWRKKQRVYHTLSMVSPALWTSLRPCWCYNQHMWGDMWCFLKKKKKKQSIPHSFNGFNYLLHCGLWAFDSGIYFSRRTQCIWNDGGDLLCIPFSFNGCNAPALYEDFHNCTTHQTIISSFGMYVIYIYTSCLPSEKVLSSRSAT